MNDPQPKIRPKIVRKRVYDDRLISANVRKKLRSGDTVISFDEVEATVIGTYETAPTALDVEIPESDEHEAITGETVLNLYCGGGQNNVMYAVALRYTPDNERQLESVFHVLVTDDFDE